MDTSQLRQAICSQVARVLREEREKRGLSMTVLGERAGLSQQMVSYVERGLRNPSLDTLLRLSGALGISLEAVVRRARSAALHAR